MLINMEYSFSHKETALDLLRKRSIQFFNKQMRRLVQLVSETNQLESDFLADKKVAARP